MTTKRIGRPTRRVLIIAVAMLVARGSVALEAKGDLSVELRVVETVMSKGALGKPATGIARIEVVIDSYRDAHDVALRLEDPAGSPLRFRSRSVEVGPLAWRDARGKSLIPGERGIVIPARGRILTRLEVPLEGAARHPIVVRATAVAGAQELAAEGFALVPLGVPKAIYEESPAEGIADFPVGGVN